MRGRAVALSGKHGVPPRALGDRVLFQEILDSLAELYSLLQEEDMWAGLWQKRCKYSETATAIAYEQHGFFEQVAPPGFVGGGGRSQRLRCCGLKAVPV